jgi:fucose 4-O-acetylase-like acetyltransferase
MPAFLFVSGFLYMPNFKKSFLRVFIPYLIVQFISYFAILLYNGDASVWDVILKPTWTLWYLLSLFTMHLMTLCLPKKNQLQLFYIVLFVIIGIISGFVENIGMTFSISRTLVFYPYFLFGYFLKTNKGILYTINVSKHFWIICLSIILLVALVIITPLYQPEWLYGRSGYINGNHYWIRMSQYLIGFLCILLLYAWIPQKQYFFTFIAEKTLLIYLIHPFVLLLFKHYRLTLSVFECFLISLTIIAVLSINYKKLLVRKHDTLAATDHPSS